MGAVTCSCALGLAPGPITWPVLTKRKPSPEDEGAPTRQQDEDIEVHHLASRVEVRTRYQRGQWAPGYEIARVVDSGYQVRRPGSPDMVPKTFVPTDVRRAGDGR
jgi:hypothetical protein